MAVQPRSLLGLGFRGHAATNARGRGRRPLPGLPRPVSNNRFSFAGARGDCARPVERTRLLPASSHAAQNRAVCCAPLPGEAAGHSGRVACPARYRPLHGGSRGQHCLRRAGAGSRRKRRAGHLPHGRLGGGQRRQRKDRATAQDTGDGGRACRPLPPRGLEPGDDGTGGCGLLASPSALRHVPRGARLRDSRGTQNRPQTTDAKLRSSSCALGPERAQKGWKGAARAREPRGTAGAKAQKRERHARHVGTTGSPRSKGPREGVAYVCASLHHAGELLRSHPHGI